MLALQADVSRLVENRCYVGRFQALSLWLMYIFSVDLIVKIIDATAQNRQLLSNFPAEDRLGDGTIRQFLKEFNSFLEIFGNYPELAVSSECVRDILEWLEGGRQLTHGNAMERLGELNRTIERELRSRVLLVIPSELLPYLSNPNPFGDEVANRLPEALRDIKEASLCIALGVSTAAVFHLMRVMEIGVQKLGDNLHVPLASEKNWQNILDEVDKAIKAFPQSTPEEKERRSIYAACSVNLYNVKLAWRNPVMHPTASYDEKEARDIYLNVKAFIQHLVWKVLVGPQGAHDE